MNRRGLIAVAHIAKQQLAIADDDWRDLLEREIGVRSCADAQTPALVTLVRALEAKGFVNHRQQRAGDAQFKKSRKPQARLCWALWSELKQCGAIRNPSREAARALFATLAGIDDGAVTDPDLMDAEQLRKAIEGLKAMVARAHAEAPAS